MDLGTTFNNQHKIVQGAVVLVVVGTSVWIGWKIYDAVKTRMSLAGSFKEKSQVDEEIKKNSDNGIKASYTDSVYSAMANQLHALMDGYGSGAASMPAIFAKVKNDVDMLKLINAYGIRSLSSGAYNPAPAFKGTLAGAIADELDPIEIGQVNRILKLNKVTITF
jgi:hypothetical protein